MPVVTEEKAPLFTITLTARWRRWAGRVLLCLVMVGGLLFACDRLLVIHVHVAGHRLFTHTVDDVRQAVSQTVERPLILRWEGRLYQFSPADLGVHVDAQMALAKALDAADASIGARLWQWLRGVPLELSVQVPVTIDQEVMRNAVLRTIGDLERQPTNARLLNATAASHVVAGQWGRLLDAEALSTLVATTVLLDSEREIVIPIIVVPPEVQAEVIAQWGNLYVLGQALTSFDSSQQGRSENIRLGAKMMDGVVLRPGDEFSLNIATGERTEQVGYKPAPVIVEGELVPGIGGGVSQLASTVYNAALLAGMRITEYHSHSQPVPYLPIGRDATVWYGQLDLRFVNPLPDPVVINADAGRDWVRVEVRSPAPSGVSVRLSTEVVEEYPVPVESQVDASLAPGERVRVQVGRPGKRVRLQQSIYEGNELIEIRRLDAVYRPQAEVWIVGKAH